VLVQRVASSIVLIPLVLYATFLGNKWYAALVVLAGLLASYEYSRMLQHVGHRPWLAGGLGLTALLLLDTCLPELSIARWGIALVIGSSTVRQILHDDTEGFLLGWALMLAGGLYIGGLFGHMVLLRNLPGGLGWVLLTFAITWTCDTGAYLGGTWWGKRPFFAHISPKKTWEGAVTGVIAGTLAGLVAGMSIGLSAWQGIAVGFLGSLGSTFGDLAESLVKRQVGVKDSGTLIPGHGGMLDRIDSLLFVGTIVYYFAVWVVQ